MGFHVALSDTSDGLAQGAVYVSFKKEKKKKTEQTPLPDKENVIFLALFFLNA